MIAPVFAFGSEITDRVTSYAVRCLTVVGAGLVGYFAGGIVIWAIDKWLLQKNTPSPIKKSCQLSIAAIAAIVMAMILFGEGGAGLFGGGGGDGKGSPSTDSSVSKSESKEKSQPKARPVVPPAKAMELSGETIVPVTVYGGSAVEYERYYQLDEEQTLKTFKELQAALLERKNGSGGKLAIAIRMPDDKNLVGGDPRLVAQLTEWAHREGMVVVLAPNR